MYYLKLNLKKNYVLIKCIQYLTQEPSLFAVAKLLETGLVNLNRVEVLWRPVTNHLLEVSSHPLNRMREWGIEAITTLVRSAIQYQHSTSLKENQVNTISYRVFFLLNLLEHF
jgi:hypothetical protein